MDTQMQQRPSTAASVAMGGGARDVAAQAEWQAHLQGLEPRMATAAAVARLRPHAQVTTISGATVLEDQWKEVDPAVVQTKEYIRNGVNDLQAAGLTYNLPNAFGTPLLIWNDSDDFTAASVSMDTQTPPEEDRTNYETRGVPIPVISHGFRMGQRFGAMSPQASTDNVRAATRAVVYKADELLFNGWAPKFRGYDIPGYTTHAARNLGTLTAGWATATPTQIVADVNSMVGMMWDDFATGPFRLYVPYTWMQYLLPDYWIEVGSPPNGVTSPNEPLMSRLMRIEGLEGIAPSLHLTDEVVMVEMSSETVEWIDGVPPSAVTWDGPGGFTTHTRVIMLGAPRIKQDQKGRCGIVHFSSP